MCSSRSSQVDSVKKNARSWICSQRGSMHYEVVHYTKLESLKFERITLKHRSAKQEEERKAKSIRGKAEPAPDADGETEEATAKPGPSGKGKVKGKGRGSAKPLSKSAEAALKKIAEACKANIEAYELEFKDFDPVGNQVDKEVPARYLTAVEEAYTMVQELANEVDDSLAQNSLGDRSLAAWRSMGSEITGKLGDAVDKINAVRKD